MNDENSGLIPVTDHELFQATTARGYEPGHIVFGRFVLRRILGRGGMGIVWLAFDNQLEQEVAIKVLPDVVMHDREAVSDMKRETKRSLQLNHHNIVRIYDFNQDDKGAGISMEFVDGETLSSAKIEQPHGCFQVEQVGPWVEQICEALAYAHDTAKIVHRDLKPANIMLGKNDVIKVTDFGIARSISDSVSRVSMRHASSGTMVYMSPQQSSGARSSATDDIYALGATIYDLLTGKPPFYSGNIQHQLENVTPPSMTERRAEMERGGTPIPESWEKAIAACLEKEPARRPASVRDLAQRLSLHITTRTPTPAPAPVPDALIVTRKDVHVPPVLPPVVPPTPRPPLIPPGLLTPARIKMAVAGVACAVVLLATPFVIMWVIGRGTLAVATVPPGALVSMGGTSQTSPATFNQTWSGKKTVNISLDGYESVEIPTQVTKNQVTDLGAITLVRSTGTVVIHSIPAQATFTLKEIQSPVAGEALTLTGHAPPWKPDPLGTGKYELTTSAEGFSDGTDDFEIKRGDTLEITADLVKDNALKSLSADQVAAIDSGQPIPAAMKQDESAKANLTGYYQQTFHGYLKIDDFKMADAQLKHLSGDLGANTADLQSQLDESQKDWTSDEGSVFKQLLAKERFASAEALLDQMDADETQPATAGMRDTLAKAKEAHEQATQKTLAAIDALTNSGKQDQAYEAAESAASHDPEEPRLQERLATFELPMLSTYDRVSTRFKAMDNLLNLDSTLGQNSEYMRLYGIFQLNVRRHDEFRTKMAPLEHQVNSFDSRISDLRAEQVHNEKKATGYKVLSLFGIAGGIAGAASGSTAGAVGGFGAAGVGQNGANARENDVHNLQSEIDELRSQRGPAEDQLSDIQNQYATLQKTPIDQVQ